VPKAGGQLRIESRAWSFVLARVDGPLEYRERRVSLEQPEADIIRL
jgi:hypothetical protein